MSPTKPQIVKVRISIPDIEPPVWRRVLLTDRMTLHELHRTIQILFAWYDYHLYQFDIRGQVFQGPGAEMETEDPTRTSLSSLRLRAGDVLYYLYDFGDDWLHEIEVEHTDPEGMPGDLPWLVDGAGRGPPEDCGGADRYMSLLRALERPLEDLDDEDRELVDWAGHDFDPDEFSLEQAQHALTLTAAWGLLKRRSR